MSVLFHAAGQFRCTFGFAVNRHVFLILTRLGRHITATLGIIGQGIGIAGIVDRDNNIVSVQELLHDGFCRKAFLFFRLSLGHFTVIAGLRFAFDGRFCFRQAFKDMVHRVGNLCR